MDTAEHMFVKCKQLDKAFTPTFVEGLADLLYEIGKDGLKKRNYESTIRWSERAYDLLGDQDMELLSPDAGELRLSTMHSIGRCSAASAEDIVDPPTVQAYMKLKTPEARDKAWQMVNLMETVVITLTLA